MRRVAMVLLFVVTASATAQAETTLVSHYEQDFVGGIGCAYVSGWVYDSGLKHWEAGKEIQVYGVISTTREEGEGYDRYIEYDNVYYFERSDVNETYGLSGNHGFRIGFNLSTVYTAWFPDQEEETSDGRTFWVRVYAKVKDGSAPAEEIDEDGYIHIPLFGPIAVGNVKSPLWQETHVTKETQEIDGWPLYTGFISSWEELVDGDLSTFLYFSEYKVITFESDEVIIPIHIVFNSIKNEKKPAKWRLRAKLHKNDGWTVLATVDWPSRSDYNLDITLFELPHESYRGYRYFCIDFWPRGDGTLQRQFYCVKEIRFAGYCYKHLLPRLATCSQTGIIKECYQRDSDGKYFADDAATIEYDASSVELPIKNHEGVAPEGAGCWQCWMCNNYFSDEACTTPWPTWSVTLPEEMELINSTFQEDPNGKYISGTEITFKAKEIYEPYIRSVKVGETVLTPDQNGVYTLTVGDADVVVTANVGLLVLANDANNADAICALSGQEVLVTLKDRTLYKDGLWNTLCLPFNMTAQQVTEKLAPKRLRTLDSVSLQGGKLTLNFADATEIQAGKPYIIRWDKADGYDNASPDTRDLKNPTFEGITIPDYSTTDIAKVYLDARCQNDYVDFIGTYAPLKISSIDKSILILHLYGFVTGLSYPAAGSVIGSGRGYFMLNGIHFAQEADQIKEFVLNLEEDDATSIEHSTLNIEHSEESIYDLSGRKVNGQWSTVNGQLPKGVYIVNGKKIIK